MDRYIHGSQTKLLCDVMAGGFEENDVALSIGKNSLKRK